MERKRPKRGILPAEKKNPPQLPPCSRSEERSFLKRLCFLCEAKCSGAEAQRLVSQFSFAMVKSLGSIQNFTFPSVSFFHPLAALKLQPHRSCSLSSRNNLVFQPAEVKHGPGLSLWVPGNVLAPSWHICTSGATEHP